MGFDYTTETYWVESINPYCSIILFIIIFPLLMVKEPIMVVCPKFVVKAVSHPPSR